MNGLGPSWGALVLVGSLEVVTGMPAVTGGLLTWAVGGATVLDGATAVAKLPEGVGAPRNQ